MLKIREWGELIHEKVEVKISWHCPFKLEQAITRIYSITLILKVLIRWRKLANWRRVTSLDWWKCAGTSPPSSTSVARRGNRSISTSRYIISGTEGDRKCAAFSFLEGGNFLSAYIYDLLHIWTSRANRASGRGLNGINFYTYELRRWWSLTWNKVRIAWKWYAGTDPQPFARTYRECFISIPCFFRIAT